MNPYLIVTGDFVRTGGMDMANYALASYLADQGREVHLVTHRAEQDLTSRPNVHTHKVYKPANSYLLGEPLLDWKGRAQAAGLSETDARVLVNGGNCLWGDVNWLHYVHAAYTPTASGAKLYRYRSALAHRRALRAERKALARARVVICNSHRTLRDAVERLNVPESRAHVVYYGVDPTRFSFVSPAERMRAKAELGWSNERPVVAFIGALSDRRKGFDTLFAAWELLCRDHTWDCDLVVVGRGAEIPLWKERAKESGISERIRFLGFRKDVPEILAATDALVHPARYEAYGLGVREALARGVPALVSAQAGVAEHYTEPLKDLLISDPGDSVDLSERLKHWRSSMDSFSEKVSSLSNTLRAHTWREMAAAIVQSVEALS